MCVCKLFMGKVRAAVKERNVKGRQISIGINKI